MIEQPATVLAVEEDGVLVRTDMSGGCQSCAVKGGCGTSLLARLFPERPRQQLRLAPQAFPRAPSVGERLVLGIEESMLQKSILLLYALPLLGLLGGALAGHALVEHGWLGLSHDPAALLFGAIGLWLGLALARQRLGGGEHRPQFTVKVLRFEPAALAVELNPGPPRSSTR